MRVADGKVVAMSYILTDADGNVIDQSPSDEPLSYLHGAGNIIPGLEAALVGMTVGDGKVVIVAPEQAYGEFDPDLVQAVPRDEFPADLELEVGMLMQAEDPDGNFHEIMITQVEDDEVMVDGNHPLAGMTLKFDIKITDVRDATSEELEHGHSHDAHYHDEDDDEYDEEYDDDEDDDEFDDDEYDDEEE